MRLIKEAWLQMALHERCTDCALCVVAALAHHQHAHSDVGLAHGLQHREWQGVLIAGEASPTTLMRIITQTHLPHDGRTWRQDL